MRILIISALIAATFLSGCSTPGLKQIQSTQGEHVVDARADYAKIANVKEGYVREVDELWIGDRDITVSDVAVDVDPAELDLPVSFRRQYPVSLQMVAEWITSHAGVQVTVAADAALNARDVVIDPTKDLIVRDRSRSTPQAQGAGDGTFLIQYQGTLRGLLNEIAARTGNSWVYRDGRAVVLHMDTRTFAVHAIPGSSKVDATISNQTSSGAAAGGGGAEGMNATKATMNSGQTTNVTTDLETYDTISKTIASMLSPKGKVFAAPGTNSVTVTDIPAILDRAEDYMHTLNASLTRQVVIDVRVYSVDVLNEESYGIDWNLVWENVSGGYRAVTNLTAGPVSADAQSLNLSVIDNANQWGGSQVLFRALSQQGNVSIKNSAAIVTMSNQPAPVQIAEETTYLAESQTQLVANAGAATSLTPGKVVTGFSMNVLPVILDSNEVLLQLQLSLSNLRNIRNIVSGDQRIEAPEVDARQFLQRVKLRSGSTLVLSGFEADRLNSDSKGIYSPSFSGAGGSRNGTRKQVVLVVTLTPKVVG